MKLKKNFFFLAFLLKRMRKVMLIKLKNQRFGLFFLFLFLLG